MRISDWSSDVCSSDLLLGARAFLPRASSPKSEPFALSLSKGRSFFQAPQREGRCFDKLSTNGRKGDADLWLAALNRHPGEGRDLTGAYFRYGEIPAFAGMTIDNMIAC